MSFYTEQRELRKIIKSGNLAHLKAYLGDRPHVHDPNRQMDALKYAFIKKQWLIMHELIRRGASIDYVYYCFGTIRSRIRTAKLYNNMSVKRKLIFFI